MYILYRKAPMAHSKAAQHPKIAPRRNAKDKVKRLKVRPLGVRGGYEAATTAGTVERVQIKLGGVTVHAKALGIAAGRIALPKMIQGSVDLEDAFLVRNVKNPTAPRVLVINPTALDQELRRFRPGRTLGDIIDVLPFGRKGVPSLRIRSLPDAGLDKRLRVPARTRNDEQKAAATNTPAKAKER